MLFALLVCQLCNFSLYFIIKGIPDSLILIMKVLLSGVKGSISVKPIPFINLMPCGELLLAAMFSTIIPLSPSFIILPIEPDINLAP